MLRRLLKIFFWWCFKAPDMDLPRGRIRFKDLGIVYNIHKAYMILMP
jgi:hypothetical protein